MRRFHMRNRLPSIWLALSMILACLVAVFADPRWAMLAVPALLGLAVLLADIWQARALGLQPRPSYGALLLALALVAATLIVGADDAIRVKQLLPILVSIAAAATTLRSRRCVPTLHGLPTLFRTRIISTSPASQAAQGLPGESRK